MQISFRDDQPKRVLLPTDIKFLHVYSVRNDLDDCTMFTVVFDCPSYMTYHVKQYIDLHDVVGCLLLTYA